MKKNNFGYLIREGIRGIFLHGFMSFAAICVTVACLIIVGSFALILYNLQVMITDLEQENDRLRKRIRTYEDVISRNNLWSYFAKHKGKTRERS